MAEHPNVEAARTSFEAFMKGDLEAMAAGIADDAVWHVPGKHRFAGDYSGRSAIVGRFAEMAQAGVRTTVEEIHDVVGNDEHVVGLVRFAIESPSGRSAQNSAWILHVRDGRATEFWAHNADQAAIDEIIGG